MHHNVYNHLPLQGYAYQAPNERSRLRLRRALAPGAGSGLCQELFKHLSRTPTRALGCKCCNACIQACNSARSRPPCLLDCLYLSSPLVLATSSLARLCCCAVESRGLPQRSSNFWPCSHLISCLFLSAALAPSSVRSSSVVAKGSSRRVSSKAS